MEAEDSSTPASGPGPTIGHHLKRQQSEKDSPTAVMLVIALIMIFTLQPETKALELEDTARV